MNRALLERPDIDLRRREFRDLKETISRRAEFALPEDRALVFAAYREGLSAPEIARLRKQSVYAVRRRLRQVAANLLSPQFAFVMRERKNWPARRRRIATACILQGRSFRETSRHLKVTMHAVRTEIAVLNALFAEEFPELTQEGASSC